VPGSNLTREEAARRAALLAVSSYDVELDLTDGRGGPGEDTFRSRTVVRFSCAEPGASTFADLVAARLHGATLNGVALEAAAFREDGLALSGLAADNELVVDADCRYMRTGEGLHRFVDPVDGSVYLYSQFETSDAHRMYACFDQPDLKAVFTLTVHAPTGWQVVSNAAVESVQPVDGAQIVTFAPTPRVSPYVTALVAGPYSVVRDSHDGIELGIYCRATLAQHLDAEEIFTVTKQGFDFFHRVFGYRYPFGAKYDQLFVPEFNAGAMENAACVTFLEDYVFRSKVTDAAYERRAETVLHEMAHMWFGDLVTMSWWDDLWLNESFATYMSVLAQASATRYTTAWTTFANLEKTWAYRQDQLPSTHPIAADIPDMEAVEVNFDGITYAKGASVLKQLVAWVGQEEFLAGLRTYFRRHEFGNTRLSDLLAVLEESSGRDLQAWSREWLETAGVNTLRTSFETDRDGTFTSFSVLQEAPADHPTLRSHRVAIGLYDATERGLERRRRLELDVVGAVTDVPKLVGERQPDLVLVNDDDLTYSKIRLDERSLATVTDRIGDLPESLARALCWAAAWDMTRDAEMPARDYVRLVLAGIERETDIGVVQSLLRQAYSALVLFADPASAPVGMTALAGHAQASMTSSPPGSDHQLAWTRAFATAARSEDHLAVLRKLLSGEQVLAGLAVDAELRWHVLGCLVAQGAAGDAEIAAEEQADPTAAGQRQAARVRALRPTPAAKAEAWAAVVEDETLPNAVQAAIIGGFQHPDQLALTEPYVARYFSVVGQVWERRSSEVAQNVVVGLYPGYDVSPRIVAETDAYLSRDGVPPALRRLLLEGRDGIRRALAARDRDTPGSDARGSDTAGSDAPGSDTAGGA